MKIFQLGLLGLLVLFSIITLICGKVYGMNVFLLMLSNVFFCVLNFIVFQITKTRNQSTDRGQINKVMISTTIRLLVSILFISGIIFYFKNTISTAHYIFIGIMYFCYLALDALFLSKLSR
jgi:hypothetical protein